MSYKYLAAAAACLSVSTPAYAQGLFDFEGAEGKFYVAGFGGGGFQTDAEFTGTLAPGPGVLDDVALVPGAPAQVDVDFLSDAFFGGAVGYRLPFKYFFGLLQPRVEVEVSFLEADAAGGAFNGGNFLFEGETQTLFILLNSYNEIRVSDEQRIIPYIGGGLGIGIVDTTLNFAPELGGPLPTFVAQGENTTFARSIAGGLTWEATERLDIYTEGRYYRVDGVDVVQGVVSDEPASFVAELDDDLDGVTWTAGLRFKF